MKSRILCIGDIHLGSRTSRLPANIGEYGIDPSELTPAATWRAAVRWAVAHDIEAMLLSGDVIENDRDRFEAYGHLKWGVEELLASREVDLYPAAEPDKAILIDGSIGEGSLFDEEFKYYAHGVGPDTATLPEGWRDRLVPMKNEFTRNVKALCLHPVDIAASKLVAGRDKDLAYVRTMLKCGIVSRCDVETAVAGLPQAKRPLAQARMAGLS